MDESPDTVEMHGREFVIGEPSVDITLRILNVMGALAVRAESTVQRVIKNPSNRAVLMGLLAVLSETDLLKLGSAVLQFESDREGRKWLAEHGLKVAPLVKALMLNIGKSDDLMESLRSFFDGIGLVSGVLEKLNLGGEATDQEITSETEAEPGQDSSEPSTTS